MTIFAHQMIDDGVVCYYRGFATAVLPQRFCYSGFARAVLPQRFYYRGFTTAGSERE